MSDRIVHLLDPKQPADVIRIPPIDFGPKLASGESVASGPVVTIWELNALGREGADYTGAMLVPSSVTLSGGSVWFDVKNGSDNKNYGGRVKATINPTSRVEQAIVIIPVRQRAK